MKNIECPQKVKRGSVIVQICHPPSHGCDSFTLSYYQDGVRKRPTFPAFDMARTARRRTVPILDNLRQWLLPHRKTDGPVCAYRNMAFEIDELVKRINKAWRAAWAKAYNVGGEAIAKADEQARQRLTKASEKGQLRRGEVAPGAHGIKYVHAPALGCPRDVRRAYREDGDWARYTRRFKAHLETQLPALEELSERMRQERCCLLCFEEDYNFCHRSFVAERVASFVDAALRVFHLAGPIEGRVVRPEVAAVWADRRCRQSTTGRGSGEWSLRGTAGP